MQIRYILVVTNVDKLPMLMEMLFLRAVWQAEYCPMPFYGQFLMLWLKARDIWNLTHLWLLLAILMIVQDCGMQN